MANTAVAFAAAASIRIDACCCSCSCTYACCCLRGALLKLAADADGAFQLEEGSYWQLQEAQSKFALPFKGQRVKAKGSCPSAEAPRPCFPSCYIMNGNNHGMYGHTKDILTRNGPTKGGLQNLSCRHTYSSLRCALPADAPSRATNLQLRLARLRLCDSSRPAGS
eukprot:1155170-Pelagomonas_calceolata.AAC.3